MNPKVSVIVPNYNHAPFLTERLESILAQSFRAYELVVLDDFSMDESQEIIRRYQNRYPWIRVFTNDRNSGSPFKQWDHGVKQARGDYIWIAESDDVAKPDFLEKMVPILDGHPRIGLAYCSAAIIDDQSRCTENAYPASGTGNRGDYLRSGRDEIKRKLCINNTINNASGVLFRRTAYIDAGGADCAMRYCGDWFLYLRLLLKWDIAYRAEKLNCYRSHAGSSFHEYYRTDAYLEELTRVYRFILQQMALPPLSKRRIREQLTLHCCLSIRKGFLPSKDILREIRRIAPYLELRAARLIICKILQKSLLR